MKEKITGNNFFVQMLWHSPFKKLQCTFLWSNTLSAYISWGRIFKYLVDRKKWFILEHSGNSVALWNDFQVEWIFGAAQVRLILKSPVQTNTPNQPLTLFVRIVRLWRVEILFSMPSLLYVDPNAQEISLIRRRLQTHKFKYASTRLFVLCLFS